ncbi:MAG TPA: GNAT family N-acetyltransferase [Gaiellaceae bacterium]|nr:GNAT family N-acetyltransferase [Gaiellaceae bacterium]
MAREDVWLSEQLGYTVVVLDDEDLAPRATARSLVVAKVPVADVARVGRLQQSGFAVVDVNVTLTCEAAEARPHAPVTDVVLVGPAEGEPVLEIAGSCFRYSRFHLDPAIPRPVADRVKREWVRSYLEGRRGVELIAAVEDGAPVGFLAVLGDSRTRVIDLIGVAESAQGRGVGSTLVSAFIERHAGSCAVLQVGTQIANIPSLRLYGSFGFAVSSAAYVLHRHDEP